METHKLTKKRFRFPLPQDRQKLLERGFRIVLALCIVATLSALAGAPMLRLVKDIPRFRAFVAASGAWGRLAFVGMMAAQIVLAFIPGEPLEIAAGCAFGPVEGTALCMLGAFIGGTAVFLLVRKCGMRAASMLIPEEKLLRSPLLRDEKRLNATALVLFLIPGTPKDLLTYCAGLTNMRLSYWMVLTSIARFPSIITSTLCGDAIGKSNLALAGLVFGGTALLALFGVALYRKQSA